LAEELALTRRRIQQLTAKYGDVSDLQELSRIEKRASIVLKEIRGEREQLALQTERRELIPHSEAFQKGVELAGIFNRMCSEALTNWPTELAGKDEIGVREALQRIFNEFTAELLATAEKL
jgi:hypothetical protein